MKPDARKHNPDPKYLRSLVERAGVSQREAAKIIGINERQMRRHLSLNPKSFTPAEYPRQYALEGLAEETDEG